MDHTTYVLFSGFFYLHQGVVGVYPCRGGVSTSLLFVAHALLLFVCRGRFSLHLLRVLVLLEKRNGLVKQRLYISVFKKIF